MKRFITGASIAIALIGAAGAAVAADPFPAQPIKDPATASRAEYGRINHAGETDFFAVTPSQTVSVTVEAAVPIRHPSGNFRPTVAVLTPGQPNQLTVPFAVPAGYAVQVIPGDPPDATRTLFDPNSIERFYRNASATVSLPGKQTSYLAVYDPSGKTGGYVLGLASSAYYENASRTDLLKQAVKLKFDAAPGRALPWWDVFAGVLALLGLVGSGVVGLAVCWPRPRSQKRLIRLRYLTAAGAFVSLGLFYAGIRILNRSTGMIAVATFQEILAVLLLLTTFWLTIQKPDRPRGGYRVFIILWGLGWFAELVLLVWYLLVTRIT